MGCYVTTTEIRGNKMEDKIMNICVGLVAASAVIACWVLLEASCAIINGAGNCILF
jgi:hypothetical protein